MWVRVESSNDDECLLFGVLDNEPVLEHGQDAGLGAKLAISYDKVRDHKKSREFTKQ